MVLALLLAIGCSYQSRKSDAIDPHHGDSLARLLRRQLSADDPVAIQTAIGCEMVRLNDLLGAEEADKVIRRVRDTIYSANDRVARERMNAKLGPREYDITCSPDRLADTGSAHP